MLKRISCIFGLFLAVAVLTTQAQKEKKTYELIYSDIQIIRQQLERLDQQVQQNQEDIQALSLQIAELLQATRLFRSEQASFQAEQKNIPSQYQVLMQRMDSIRNELALVAEKLIEIQRASLPSAVAEETDEEPPPEGQAEMEAPPQEQGEEQREEPPPSTLPPGLSPQEVYNMARSDYLKGNFQLAIESFSIYKDHFPESPLVDNALYWIGECYFSQQKYQEAISQFDDLILSYPQGDKIASAYLKKGISLMEMEKNEEALAVFKTLIGKFPLEEETRIAQQKIKDLGIR
ncbi:MAG: tol-pal system protein YbgF [Candidatus Aminicenantes bacterium]|nr:tol-pal system protein YbgF [Candidatus Aminicenantes bacterium]